MKIFLICPVANIDSETLTEIELYVSTLTDYGKHEVHWPYRDTEQDDPTGGYQICHTNVTKILEADEIHIWYDEKSGGSKFDMGATFTIVEIFGNKKKIVIANEDSIPNEIKNAPKNFYQVFQCIIKKNKVYPNSDLELELLSRRVSHKK